MRLFVGVVLAATLAVSGCADPVGDGRIADKWPAMSEAKLALPVVGTCSQTRVPYAHQASADSLAAVGSCTDAHQSELIHLGTYSGADADKPEPPVAGSDAERRAFAECATKAVEFVGDHWRGARLSLRVLTAPGRHWTAGGKYFRCELFSLKSEKGEPIPATASAKDGLRGSRPLAVGCVDLVDEAADGSYVDMVPIECAQPHSAEFVGVFKMPEMAYPTEAQADRLYDLACLSVIAGYLGASPSALANVPYAYIAWPTTKDVWALGDRSVNCYISPVGRAKLKSSVKGWGARALPT